MLITFPNYILSNSFLLLLCLPESPDCLFGGNAQMCKKKMQFTHLKDTFDSEIPKHCRITANLIPDHTRVEGSLKTQSLVKTNR